MNPRIGRRAWLGGAAVALGLPFLPSLVRRTGREAAAATNAPKRFLVYYVPNGCYQPSWTPKTTGTDYDLSPILAGLAPVKDDVLVLSGLTNTVGVPPTTGGAHVEGSGALLTCQQYMKDNKINLGKSIDQVIADAIGTATKLPSLELGITDRANPDGPGILAANISWKTATTPAPPIENPQVAFNRMFQGFDPNASQADAERRRVYRTSVLDVAQKDAQHLLPRLSSSDKNKVDEYMTSVRDVETRIQTDPALGASCKVPASAPANGADFPAQVDVTHQLISLAFQCDVTRVITFMHGQALGGRSFPFLGIDDDGHSVTHHSGDPTKIAQETKIDAWRITQLAALVQMLKALPDVDGKSILSNTVIYYTSEIADGNSHSQDNKPVLLAGQLGGAFKTGQHIEFPAGAMGKFKVCNEFSKAGCGQPQIADLYLTFLQAFGINTTGFGGPASFGAGMSYAGGGTGPLMNLGG
jgi:hypothetical protein